MAKIRVYELAKDLNMTNKALLDKMQDLNLEVKSHMSSLEESTVSTIKRSLVGKKKKKIDVKVKASVIRRRRPKDENIVEPELVDSEKEDQEAAKDQEIVEPENKESKSNLVQEKALPEEPESEQPIPAAKAEPALKKSKPKQKVKKGQPAKIIKPVEKKTQVKKQEPKTKKEEPKEELEVEKAEPPQTREKEKIAEKEDKQTSDQKSEPTAAKDKEKKRKKRKKKEKPAKIVKTVDPSVLENIKKSNSDEDTKRVKQDSKGKGQKKPVAKKDKEPFVPPVIHEADVLQADDISKPGKTDKATRKKVKRKIEFDDDKTAGKRKQRRKKSVVEGDALYKGGRGRKKKGKKSAKAQKGNFQKTQITTPKAIKRRIKIDEAIELSELAKRMGIKANEMIAKLMTMGVMATVNQTIDFDTAVLVATEFGFEVEKASFEEETLMDMADSGDDEGKMVGRAPVVTIMGHVDHGKTSLLDVIRESKITSGEAGGITQHIGAYNVETPNGGRITFLDTPGHAAFTAMRSRGAQVTDIVILVVSADDGVMPQTIEAINHSKAAGVPVVVAVNKMDKAGADPDKIMRELSELDLLAEDWGGDVIFVKVSAKTRQGIDELLEMVLLQSEVLELKANPDRKAMGYVVESRLDVGRGVVATVLVKHGTLSDGDSVVCGLYSGRIRAMIDENGERIDAAGPSTPAEIVGLNGVPDAGDEFIAVATDKDAKQISEHRMQKQRAKELAKKSRANLEKMFENLGTAEVKELKLIVKADVHGSIEALNDSLKELAKEEVNIKIVHSGAGTINESDVSLAAVSDAIIIGFNVRPAPQIRTLAKEENVDLRFYDIIYDVINDIKSALHGMMPSTFHEIIIGQANVRDTFVIPKMGTIAGCHIEEGKVIRGKKIRLLRDGIIKCDTQISSLRRFKDDVKKVEQGFECGIGLEKYNNIKVGDVIECYEVEERKYKAD